MALLVSEEALRERMYQMLHGDEKHQEWLKNEIEKIIDFCKKPLDKRD